MLKCEINKNIVSQNVEVYLFHESSYFVYNKDGEFEIHDREPFVAGMKPYLTIRYDIWDALREAFKKELDVEKIEGSAGHIKDLRWVLAHFLNKDK